MKACRIVGLSERPLDAAAQFYAEHLPGILEAIAAVLDGVVVVFDGADYTHTGWRLAAVQQLARDHTPRRINAIAGGDERAAAAALRYLEAAPGVTGQMLQLDGNGAGEVLSRS